MILFKFAKKNQKTQKRLEGGGYPHPGSDVYEIAIIKLLMHST